MSAAGPSKGAQLPLPRGAAWRRQPQAWGHTNERFHFRLLELVGHSRHGRLDRLLRVAPPRDEPDQGQVGTRGVDARQGGADRPHVGRRPRRVQQPAAAVVDVAVLDHDPVLGRLPDRVSGAGQHSRSIRVDFGKRAREGERCRRGRDQAAVRQVPRDGPAAGGGGSGSARDGRAAVPQPLRAMPWLGCRRQPRLPQPARRRLALRRRAGDDPRIDHERPHGRDAGAGRGARRGRHEERRRVRALAVRPRARRTARADRQAAVRAELRRLSRHGRQGQPGGGRAESHRQGLAVRQLGGDDHRRRQQGSPPRHGRGTLADAGAQGHARRRARSRSSPRTSGACPTRRPASSDRDDRSGVRARKNVGRVPGLSAIAAARAIAAADGVSLGRCT